MPAKAGAAASKRSGAMVRPALKKLRFMRSVPRGNSPSGRPRNAVLVELRAQRRQIAAEAEADLSRAGDHESDERRLAESLLRFGDTQVREIMTPRPITVTARLPVSAALARMASLGLGRLPVVADEQGNYPVAMPGLTKVV